MTATVGTTAQPVDVYVRVRRSGWRRFWPNRALIATVDLDLPVHAHAGDNGDVTIGPADSGEIFRALADGLRKVADSAEQYAADGSADYR